MGFIYFINRGVIKTFSFLCKTFSKKTVRYTRYNETEDYWQNLIA
jgi:hypothetical protein